jgi:hypothetical protein
MTDRPWTDDVTSPAAFSNALEQLLIAADDNGVDPLGSWVCDTDDDAKPDYEIVVYELD